MQRQLIGGIPRDFFSRSGGMDWTGEWVRVDASYREGRGGGLGFLMDWEYRT